MNLKTMIPLVVALALAVVAAKVGRDMMSKGKGADPSASKLVKLVVAKEDLPPGSTVKETDVTLKDLPADGSSQYTFNNVADVVYRVVTTQLVKGQAVLDTLLAPKGATGVGAMV